MTYLHDSTTRSSRQELSRGSLSGGTALLAGYAAQYLFIVISSRLLGADQAGRLFVLLSLVTLGALIARGGLERIAIKYMAIYSAAAEGRKSRWLFFTVLARTLAISVVLALLFALAARPLLRLYELDVSRATFTGCLLLIPLLATSQVTAAFLRGSGRVGSAGIVQHVLLYSSASATILVSFVRGQQPTLVSAAFGLAIGAVLSAVVGAVVLRACMRTLTAPTPIAADERRAVFSGAFYFWMIAVLSFFTSSVSGLDVLIIGAVTDSVTVARYVAVSRTVILTSFGLVTINNMLAPLVARSHASSDTEAMQNVVSAAARWSLASTLVLSGGLILVSEQVLGAIGFEYASVTTALYVLVLAQLVNAATGPVSMVMQMTGDERRAALSFACVLALMIPAYAFAAGIWGVVGAAVVTAVGRSVQWIWMVSIVERFHNLRTYVFNEVAAPTLALAIGVLALKTFVPVVPGIAFYALLAPVFVWKLMLQQEDRDVLRLRLHRHGAALAP